MRMGTSISVEEIGTCIPIVDLGPPSIDGHVLNSALPIRYVENEWRRRTYLQGIYDTWIFGQRRNNVCLPRGLYKDRVGYLRAGMAVQ